MALLIGEGRVNSRKERIPCTTLQLLELRTAPPDPNFYKRSLT